MSIEYSEQAGSPIRPFRYFTQKVLPAVYDDSLSYMELVAKTIEYLNQAIEAVNANSAATTEMQALLAQYKQFMDDYFNNLDVQEEIDNKLDAMVANGTFTQLMQPIITQLAPTTIEQWLDDHPEATTTIEDNSVSDVKLVQTNGVLASVSSVKETINKYLSIEPSNIIINNSKNLFQGTGATTPFSPSNYRVLNTERYDFDTNMCFELTWHTDYDDVFGTRTRLVILYYDTNDNYLGLNGVDNDSSIEVNGRDHPNVRYIRFQFYRLEGLTDIETNIYINDFNNYPAYIDLNFGLPNFKQMSWLPNDYKIELSFYEGLLNQYRKANEYFPQEKKFINYGGFSRIGTSPNFKLRRYYDKTLINTIIPFDFSKNAFKIINNETFKYYFFLLDDNFNVVGWDLGNVWITAQEYIHELTPNIGNYAKYIAFTISKIDGTNFNLDNMNDNSPIDFHLNPIENNPSKIRIMEYNIGHYCYGQGTSFEDVGLPPEIYDEKVRNMKLFFGEYQPDVLCLCEYYQYLDLAHTKSADEILFDPIYKYKYQSEYWNALKSNIPFINKTHNTLTPQSNKDYFKAQLNVNGKLITIILVHLMEDETIQTNELNSLYNIASNAGENVIICGDFNIDINTDINKFNSFINNGFKLCNGGYFGITNTWNYNNPTKSIDNILVKGNIIIKNYSVINEGAALCSDHLPTYTDILIY